MVIFVNAKTLSKLNFLETDLKALEDVQSSNGLGELPTWVDQTWFGT